MKIVREDVENRVLNAVDMMQKAGMSDVQIKEVVTAISSMVAFEAAIAVKNGI